MSQETDTTTDITYLHLEVKRIQTYLFSVPRLKAMVGANVILGETMMGTKGDLTPSKPPTEPENLVQLAIELNGLYKISNISLCDEQKKWFNNDALPDDDPLKFAKHGIISRHGGHFSAFFKTKEDAEKFESAARMLIAQRLPGAMVQCDLSGIAKMKKKLMDRGDNNTKGTDTPKKPKYKNDNPVHSLLIPEIPAFALCQGSGSEAAAVKEIESYQASESFAEKLKAADRFYLNQTADIVGLMIKSEMLPKQQTDAKSLEDISQKGYLAIIHADGNNTGKLSGDWATKELDNLKLSQDELSKKTPQVVLELFVKIELAREAFFFSMRCATRKAVAAAITSTFDTPDKKNRYRLFMAGGDDLLLVCRVDLAIDFITNYAQAFEELDNKLVSGENLSIGAGIVIAHHNIPINQLHALAEELASNAKKRNKYLTTDPKHPINDSVVDWIISAESYLGDIDQRQKNIKAVPPDIDETCWLTMKPYKILGTSPLSLEYLKKKAKSLIEAEKGGRIARSKYKGLLDEMKKGSISAELAIKEIEAESSGSVFETIKNDMEKQNSGLPVDYWPFLYAPPMATNLFSFVPDLIELAEISKLGNKRGER